MNFNINKDAEDGLGYFFRISSWLKAEKLHIFKFLPTFVTDFLS